MHLFLVYTASDGQQTYLRGGPGAGGATACDIGPYEPSTVDWDPSAPSVTVAVGATFNANRGGLGGLEAIVTGENCNATAWTLLEMAGLPKKKPSGLHPGWGHRLGALLNPDLVELLDLPAVADGVPAELVGDARIGVQVYADRARTEKLTVLPGGTAVAVIGQRGPLRQIRFGAEPVEGWVDVDDVLLAVAGARTFWVAGARNGFVAIDGTDGYADCGHAIQVLDPSWQPGDDAKRVKVRYTDPWHKTHEGFVWGHQLTDQHPGGD